MHRTPKSNYLLPFVSQRPCESYIILVPCLVGAGTSYRNVGFSGKRPLITLLLSNYPHIIPWTMTTSLAMNRDEQVEDANLSIKKLRMFTCG